MITFGSLFTGIGGFDLGLEQAGLRCLWQVEIDDYATKVLERHWPHVKRFRDVRDCGRQNLEPVDLLCAGFPCQPFSVAGKRMGEEDERNLWPETARLIRDLRPPFVLLENVPGLLVHGYFGQILGELAEGGYDCEWDCIPASAFGAPHKRERLWLFAYANGERRGRWSEAQHRSKENGTKVPGRGGEEMSQMENPDNGSQRVQRFWSGQIPRITEFSWCENVGRVEDLRGRSDIPEPLVRGTGHGVSGRVDRIRCLGNAIVPPIARWIGQLLMNFKGGFQWAG